MTALTRDEPVTTGAVLLAGNNWQEFHNYHAKINCVNSYHAAAGGARMVIALTMMCAGKE
jgi:hypothetical protein